nr:AAC(3) family N-acetyltransferase [bacterium]
MDERSMLAGQLSELGIVPGMKLEVHSSFKSMGLRTLAPLDVVDILYTAVGREKGLVAMPTHTLSLEHAMGRDDWAQPYHPKHAISRVCGAMTEAIRHYPGACRSDHPSHSITAIGGSAADITRGHLAAGACGIGSPLHRIAASGGKVLLIGVGLTSMTLGHVGEFIANLPWLQLPYDAKWGDHFIVQDDDGSVRRVPIRGGYAGCSSAFGRLRAPLEAGGYIKCGKLGQADCLLVEGAAVLTAVCAMLAADPASLFCDDPHCPCCPPRRALTDKLKAEGKV